MSIPSRQVRVTLLLLPVVYLSGLAKVADFTGVIYLLFPELAALAYDILSRPNGTWARSPAMVAVTPVFTAMCGIVIARLLPYGPWSVALCIASAILTIHVLRSPVAPAISAALLPLSLGVTSWWYPPSIAMGTAGLACLSILTRRIGTTMAEATPPTPSDELDDEMEEPPRDYRWMGVFVAFLVSAYMLGQVTGLRLILFPPLIVIAFEMLAHVDGCPWAQRPLAVPLACTIAAASGVAALCLSGPGPVSVALSMAAGIAAVRALRVHVPPALAVSLLPQVIDQPDWRFVLAVAIGSTLLTTMFLAVRVARPVMMRMSSVRLP
ncbi:HPP family protein [Massilia putida]|uniref:HPP family protein n=1 Tax=Massilia putida TaxID=1141883 RepID=UPI00095254E7|nr:HPP family protein [Massilia putida]